MWVEPYCLLVKIFLKDNMGWTVLSFGQNFSEKTLYGLNHIFFWLKFSQKTIWVKPYCLLLEIFLKDNLLIKIFQKDYFLRYPDFNSWVRSNFPWQYGSCADKTVQVVQMDNKVQGDNTGWNIKVNPYFTTILNRYLFGSKR